MPVQCTSASRTVQAWKPYGDVIIRYLCPEDGENRAINLGQVSEVNIAYEIEEDSLPDYRKGQGEAASDSVITSMGLGMVCHEIADLDVLSALVLGERATVEADPAAAEIVRGYPGAELVLDNIPTGITSVEATDGSAASAWAATTAYAEGDAVIPGVANDLWYSCTTAGTSDAAEPTWPLASGETVTDGDAEFTCMGRISLEEDVDYTVGNFGPKLTDGVRINASDSVGVDLTVTYAHEAQNVVHAGMHTGREYEVFFQGYNKALSDKLMLVHIYRAKSAPADELPLIATEYAGANTTYKILSYGGAAANESPFWTYREVA